MSASERSATQGELREEFIEQLSERPEPVNLDYLVAQTSVENRREAKQVLRSMIDEGMISSTPGFKYKLASDVSATA